MAAVTEAESGDADDGGSKLLWAWYGFLVVFCCCGNIIHMTYVWIKTRSADDMYSQAMRILAVPYVVNCAYRSVFVSLYLQRYVFWDTPLNGILVDRGLACVGELCCVLQTSLALCHVDRQITGGRLWIQASAWLSFVIYVIAEGCSYYNVATTDELWCAIEVDLDGSAYLVLFPACIYLILVCPGSILDSSAKKFLVIMVPLTVLYPLYNFFVDAPLYLGRYTPDQKAGKHYFDFWEGLEDAATRRVFTHDYNDWKKDMLWMVLYFFLGATGSIMLMYAPKLKPAKPATTVHVEDEEENEAEEEDEDEDEEWRWRRRCKVM